MLMGVAMLTWLHCLSFRTWWACLHVQCMCLNFLCGTLRLIKLNQGIHLHMHPGWEQIKPERSSLVGGHSFPAPPPAMVKRSSRLQPQLPGCQPWAAKGTGVSLRLSGGSGRSFGLPGVWGSGLGSGVWGRSYSQLWGQL